MLTGTTMLMGLLFAGPWEPLAVFWEHPRAWADRFLLAFLIIMIMKSQIVLLLFLHFVALRLLELRITRFYRACGRWHPLLNGCLGCRRNQLDLGRDGDGPERWNF